jgi:hypothetical protein
MLTGLPHDHAIIGGMTSTHRCPRCTAVLPVSAQFCRRCGAAQVASAGMFSQPPSIQARQGDWQGSGAVGGVERRRVANAQAMPLRPRTRLTALVGFLGVLAAGLVFMVHSQRVEIPTSSVPATAIPENTTVDHYYSQPIQAPVVIRPNPQVIVPISPSYSGRDDEHRRESHGHEEHGR